MKQIVLLISLLFLASCCHVQHSESPPENLIYPATALLSANDYNCVGSMSLDARRACLLAMTDRGAPVAATIFWISDSVFFTAAHAAVFAERDPEAHLVMQRNYKYFQNIPIENIQFIDELDVAIGIVLAAPEHNVLTFCENVFEGEKVTLHGLPPDLGPTTVPGQVFGLVTNGVLISTIIRPGYSGGPVISKSRQCVVGMSVEYYPSAKIAMAVSAEALKVILDAITSIPKAGR